MISINADYPCVINWFEESVSLETRKSHHFASTVQGSQKLSGQTETVEERNDSNVRISIITFR